MAKQHPIEPEGEAVPQTAPSIPGAVMAPPPKPAKEPVSHVAATSIRVRAKRMGYFDHARRRVGDVFTLPVVHSSAERKPHGDLFSETWMEVVAPHTPEKITTGAEELKAKHDDIVGARSGVTRASDTPVLG